MNAITPVSLPNNQIDFPIFDSDTHWTEPKDLWTSRAPAKIRDDVMQVKRTEDLPGKYVDRWYVGEKSVAYYGPCIVRDDLSKQTGVFSLSNSDEMSLATSDVGERIKLMDKMGVGSQIVYPNAIGFGASTMLKVGGDAEYRLFHIQAYNDALVDMARDSGNRMLGQMALPFWDIEASIKEMERGRKLGLTGVTMTSCPGDWKQPSLVDRAWDGFYAAAQDMNVPLNFHIGSGSIEAALDNPAYWGDRNMFPDGTMFSLNGRFAIYQGAALQMDNQSIVLNLLVSGLLDRFPRLKFVSVESGLGWVPFLLKTMENQMREVAGDHVLRSFKREPREAFKEQIFVTYWFEDRHAVDYYVKTVGSDNCMFQTDFPHPVSMYPGLQAAAAESTSNLSEDVRYKVLCGNAERLYGTKVGALGNSPLLSV